MYICGFYSLYIFHSLNVLDGSAQIAVLKSNLKFVKIGDELKLTCDIKSNLGINVIVITKDSEKIVRIAQCCEADTFNAMQFELSHKNILPKINEISFTITRRKVAENYSGVYKCEFTLSNYNEVASNEVTVRVGSPPTVKLQFFNGNQKLKITVFNKQSQFSARCLVNGTDTTVMLYKNAKLLAQNNNGEVLESSVYNMKQPDELFAVHNKVFKCIASNPWGSIEDKKRITVRRKLIVFYVVGNLIAAEFASF